MYLRSNGNDYWVVEPSKREIQGIMLDSPYVYAMTFGVTTLCILSGIVGVLGGSTASVLLGFGFMAINLLVAVRLWPIALASYRVRRQGRVFDLDDLGRGYCLRAYVLFGNSSLSSHAEQKVMAELNPGTLDALLKRLQSASWLDTMSELNTYKAKMRAASNMLNCPQGVALLEELRPLVKKYQQLAADERTAKDAADALELATELQRVADQAAKE